LALIETLFQSLIRHHPKGQGGLVKDFEGNVAARVQKSVEEEAEAVEASPGGGEDSVAGNSRQQKKKAEDSAKPTLVVVIGALFDCMAAELNRVWTMEVKANGAEFVLPAPLLTALLEEECCLASISDLLITLQLPEVANTAWGYALASAAAETSLKDLNFSRSDFAEVHGCPRLTRARFVHSVGRRTVGRRLPRRSDHHRQRSRALLIPWVNSRRCSFKRHLTGSRAEAQVHVGICCMVALRRPPSPHKWNITHQG
jgi:hypothetical protein